MVLKNVNFYLGKRRINYIMKKKERKENVMDKRVKHGKLKGHVLFYLDPERREKLRLLKSETGLTSSEFASELIDEAYQKYLNYKEGKERSNFIANLLSRVGSELDQITIKK